MESSNKQSAHAKRRLQKKQKKQDQPGSTNTNDQDQEERENIIQELSYTENEIIRKQSETGSNLSMTDESKPISSDSKPKGVVEQIKAKSKKQNKGGNQKQSFLKQPVINDKNVVVNSSELGMTGENKWWDEEKFNEPRAGATFDKAGDHDYYFNSYSSHHIHEEMLKDSVRTLTYQAAIEGNPDDFKDKIVLDIGCGTGILSIFAARAGAKHVYAVDNAEIALFAREIVKKNGLEDKITVYKGKMEEIEFPFKEGEVDIIISEWMGYYLLYESMLDCVLWARDKYLRKGTGKMLPDRAQIFVAAIEDSEYKVEKKNFWQNVYGVDMSVMNQGLWRDPMVDTVPSAAIMSDACCVLDIDLVNMKQSEVNFSNYYSLNMQYTDNIHALVTWFDCEFGNLKRPCVLTTSPMKKYTHWKQSVFYLEKPISVRKGDVLYGTVATKQDPVNFRNLNIKISYHCEGQQEKTHFDQQYKFK